jgi:hypothetical protein
LVATRPLPETDARRAAVLDAGVGVLAVLLVVGLGMGTGFLIGIGLLIVGLVFYLQGRMKIGRPLPTFQRGVALEMVAIFLLLFIGMKFVGEALASSGGLGRWSLPALLGLQWCLALVIFWPRLRGASSGEMREALGLHRGRGVLNEIGVRHHGLFGGAADHDRIARGRGGPDLHRGVCAADAGKPHARGSIPARSLPRRFRGPIPRAIRSCRPWALAIRSR